VLAKRLDARSWQRNGTSGVVGLGGHEAQLATDPLECLDDLKRCAIKIHVHPPQAKQLAASQAEIQGQDVASGAVIGAVGIYMGISQFRSRIVVTAQGLTSSYLLRRKTVPWVEIQDVVVVGGSSLRTTYSPGIKTGSGMVRLNGVIGSRPYVENIVAGIRASRPAAPAAPGPEQAATGPRTGEPDSAV
jgi:hypothetical protein